MQRIYLDLTPFFLDWRIYCKNSSEKLKYCEESLSGLDLELSGFWRGKKVKNFD